MGFGAPVRRRRGEFIGEVLAQVHPEDLIRYGLIPEFVGRLPVVASLDELSQSALVRILTEPKNALVKQFQKMLELDGIQLEFEASALEAVAGESVQRKVGARGLRIILEELMLDIMYEAPSLESVKEIIVTEKDVKARRIHRESMKKAV